jgi:RNA polymerase sigma-70 factor (sigma-E family)
MTASEPQSAPLDSDLAFTIIFEAHYAPAVRLAFLLCGDGHQAEDIAAETFARIYPQWRRGRIEDLPPYLRKTLLNEVRRRARRRVLERREAQRRTGSNRGGRSLEDAAVERDVILEALARLPVRQRAAVVLRFYADLSEADAAVAMGTSVGTIKAHASRGLRRMRGFMEDQE